MAPSEEEESKLKSYSDDKLAPSERFLRELLNVPFVFKRVDALLFVATFDSKIEHLKQSFGVIQVYYNITKLNLMRETYESCVL